MSSAPALLWRRLTAELLGSAFLAAVVIGAGIAAQRLSPGQTGLQLLEDAAATAAGLFAIILMFGRMFSDTFAGIALSSVPPFIAAQIIGGILAAAIIKALYPAITPADAADIIVPHRGDDGRARALSRDGPAGPASLTRN